MFSDHFNFSWFPNTDCTWPTRPRNNVSSCGVQDRITAAAFLGWPSKGDAGNCRKGVCRKGGCRKGMGSRPNAQDTTCPKIERKEKAFDVAVVVESKMSSKDRHVPRQPFIAASSTSGTMPGDKWLRYNPCTTEVTMCTACCKPTEFAVFGRNVEACTKSFGVNPLMYLKGMSQECKSVKEQKWKRTMQPCQ